MLTVVGCAVGLTAFLVVTGLSQTAGSQVEARFDRLRARSVTIRPGNARADGGRVVPPDAEQRIGALHGVTAVGLRWPISLRTEVDRFPDGSGPGSSDVGAFAVTPGYFAVVGARFVDGAPIRPWEQASRAHVAVLGEEAAHALGVATVDASPAVWVDGVAFTVVGIFADTTRDPEMAGAVAIPDATARTIFGDPGDGEVLEVTTRLGAAALVARQAPVALDPTHPAAAIASTPPEALAIRHSVHADVGTLITILGGVSLLVAVIGTANATLSSVLERRSEIGLRRALGATPAQVGLLFLTEAVLLGVAAGLLATAVGTNAVVLISASRHWHPVLDLRLVAAGPVAGLLTGLVAGMQPARRAARLTPAVALRR